MPGAVKQVAKTSAFSLESRWAIAKPRPESQPVTTMAAPLSDCRSFLRMERHKKQTRGTKVRTATLHIIYDDVSRDGEAVAVNVGGDSAL